MFVFEAQALSSGHAVGRLCAGSAKQYSPECAGIEVVCGSCFCFVFVFCFFRDWFSYAVDQTMARGGKTQRRTQCGWVSYRDSFFPSSSPFLPLVDIVG